MQYAYCIRLYELQLIQILNHNCINIISVEEYLLFLVHGGVENGVTDLVVTRRVSYVVNRKKKRVFNVHTEIGDIN